MKVFTKIGSVFPKGPSLSPKLTYMWGAKELDRSETNFFNVTFKGQIVWDKDFSTNFHEVKSQQLILDVCNEL